MRICATTYKVDGKKWHCMEPVGNLADAVLPDDMPVYCPKCRPGVTRARLADLKRAKEASIRENERNKTRNLKPLHTDTPKCPTLGWGGRKAQPKVMR